MRLIKIALTALGVALVAAQPHKHSHRHLHAGSKVEIRGDPVVVAGPVETVYELDGKIVDKASVEKGVKDGIFVLLTDEAPPPTIQTVANQFAEIKAETKTPEPAKPTPTPEPVKAPEPAPTPVKAVVEVEKPKPAAPQVEAPKAPSGGSGIDADFPSGKVDCSHFPSDYGAIEIDWLKMDGWIGLQKAPGYTPGVAISTIHTGIAGDNCRSGVFCSYACPPGYQKAQWPTTQGATGQSVGGLYCNLSGKLELTNPDLSKKLCIKGTGEVKVKNNIGRNIPICRTDYPGTESETVPLNTQPGGEYELTCPDANKYYRWGNAATSAQYYINPAGSPVEDACRWNEAGSNMGNWAPVNLGVGKGPGGMTYISIFRNAPTNPDGKLNFSIKITGDVSGKCEYRQGTFWNNGVESPSGCTVLVTGVATYELNA